MLRIRAGPLGVYSLVAMLAEHVQSPRFDSKRWAWRHSEINSPSFQSCRSLSNHSFAAALFCFQQSNQLILLKWKSSYFTSVFKSLMWCSSFLSVAVITFGPEVACEEEILYLAYTSRS